MEAMKKGTQFGAGHGFNPELERAALDGSEYQFGAASPECAFAIGADRRFLYLPTGELQAGKEDFVDCVSRGYVNIAETKLTHAYRNNLLTPQQITWLFENGYIVFRSGLPWVELSDAFIAILSGTRRDGNSLKAPADAIYRHGLVPKKLIPRDPNMTFDEYHNPKRVTPQAKALGKEFLKRFRVFYEQVPTAMLDELLVRDMAGLGVYAWPERNKTGEYPRTDGPFGHLVVGFNLPKTFVFDNYPDAKNKQNEWVKKLAEDYAIFEHGYRIYFLTGAQVEERITLLTQIVKMLTDLMKALVGIEKIREQEEAVQPDSVAEPAPTPVKEYLRAFALAIQEFEGYAAPGEKDRSGKVHPNGSLSWRNKNPGNIKRKDGAWYVFPTYEDGFQHLKNYLERACTGKHTAYRPNMTIRQFFGVYAPDGEKTESAYTNYVCKRISGEVGEMVTPARLLKTLV